MAGDAGWRDDPSGRHQYRYWNGTSWTDDVADNGVQGTDVFEGGGDATQRIPQIGQDATVPTPVATSTPWSAAPVGPRTAWHEQTWFIVLMLFLCFPIGLIFVWRKPWQQGVKIAITAAVAILFVGTMVASALTSSSNNAPRVSIKPLVTTTEPATTAPTTSTTLRATTTIAPTTTTAAPTTVPPTTVAPTTTPHTTLPPPPPPPPNEEVNETPGPFIPYPGNGLGPTECTDEMWSHSAGRGTCSGHGGVE